MWNTVFLFIACVLHAGSVLGQWSCTQDAQCADVPGSICRSGICACPDGQQIVGARCVDLAPYHTSKCVEDHQCSRMFSFYECRREDNAEEGECLCLEGHHYFLGRCWKSVAYGEACTADEECLGLPRDPFSLKCDGTCSCAPGYYERQRGECRKIGYAVGDGCVLDGDCQFANGICDLSTMLCQLSAGTKMATNTPAIPPLRANLTSSVTTSVRASTPHGAMCYPSATCEPPYQCSSLGACVCPLGYYANENGDGCNAGSATCEPPYQCSSLGACICPLGYYANENGDGCDAELGSVSTEEQCVGLLAVVRDGVCECPANFYYNENMRDCIKVSRTTSESCVMDMNCHTFGVASICGAAQEPWPLRSCECDPELSVWEEDRQMCRLFAGVGEMCEVDSDCLAGELEIQCVADSTGQGYCVCPEGYLSVDGLCLTTGLSIGDACQASQECTETANTACISGQCSCSDGYQLEDDFCAPIIGGSCVVDEDCVVEDTVCRQDGATSTCQCRESYVAYNETCWPASEGYEANCTHTGQCETLGLYGICQEGRCGCLPNYHHRDGSCWPITGIFDSCSRSSECYLSSGSERVVCRNSLCQCDFDFPYSESLQTCLSSATSNYGSVLVITASALYLLL